MTRPRESLLSLFDPLNLHGNSTPEKRDVMWSPSSDKENSEPCEPGQLTAFFNRTHAFQKASLAPIKPMSRLVDVGDTTVALSDWADDDEDEHEASAGCNVSNGVEQTPRQGLSFVDDGETPMPVQRKSFVDISPEPTPFTLKQMYMSAPEAIPCPANPPMTSVVDNIHATKLDEEDLPQVLVHSPSQDEVESSTFSAMTAEELIPANVPLPASPEPTDEVVCASLTLGASTAHLVPSATAALLTHEPTQLPEDEDEDPVQASADESLAQDPDQLSSSTDQLIPSATTALLTQEPLSESVNRPLSPAGSHTTPPIVVTVARSRSRSPTKNEHTVLPPQHDHDRLLSADLDVDADLHSFNIHIDNQDSSFDILNDKISFFHGAGGDIDKSLLDAGMGVPRDCSADGEDVAEDDVGNTSMAKFDIRDEETRMKAFLRLSSNNEGEQEPVTTVVPNVSETNTILQSESFITTYLKTRIHGFVVCSPEIEAQATKYECIVSLYLYLIGI